MYYPPRPLLALTFLLVGTASHVILILLAALALFEGDVATLAGLSWALDTAQHRFVLLLAVATLGPVSALLVSEAYRSRATTADGQTTR